MRSSSAPKLRYKLIEPLGMKSSGKEGHDFKSGAGNRKNESKMRSNGRNENLAKLSDKLGADHKKKARVSK